MSTPNPHDALFKATFSQPEHAAGEIRAVLPPAISARIDFTALTLRPGSFVDDALKERHSDVLYSAPVAGRDALIYVLLEHQSTDDPLMPFRLLRYLVRIWETWLVEHPDGTHLPVIVPVVLHHSDRGWTKVIALEELLDVDAETLAALGEHVPRFRFVLDDISFETDEALKERTMSALGRLVLFCLRHAREPEEILARIGRWTDLVREVKNGPNGRAALAAVWRYILLVNARRKPEDIVARLVAAVGQENEEEIVTAGEILIERGRQEKHRELLLKLLRSRFGALPEEVVMRVNNAELAQLDVWFERGLTATALDAVLS